MKTIQFNPTIPRYLIGRAVGRSLPGILWSGLSCTQYREIPEPSLLADDWVKVKTRFGGICGTDLSTIRLHTSLSLTPFCSFPAVFGHEGVGSVCEIGSAIRDFRIGDRVVLEPTLWCTPRGIADPCQFCRQGKINICEHWADGKLAPGMGIGACHDTGGTWSPRFVAHSTQVHHIPGAVSDKNALMVEPFSTALHAVLNNFPRDDENVAILGAGTIGLCVIIALRVLGSKAQIIAFARHDFQAQLAEKVGASKTIRGSDSAALREFATSVGAKIMEPLLGDQIMVGGADRIFECVGSESSIRNSLAMARSGGRIILVGVPSLIRLDWTPMTIKELTISASYAYHHAEQLEGKQQSTFAIALKLMDEGKVNLEWMVTHLFRLVEYKRAFEMFTHRGNSRVIKAAFVFE